MCIFKATMSAQVGSDQAQQIYIVLYLLRPGFFIAHMSHKQAKFCTLPFGNCAIPQSVCWMVFQPKGLSFFPDLLDDTLSYHARLSTSIVRNPCGLQMMFLTNASFLSELVVASPFLHVAKKLNLSNFFPRCHYDFSIEGCGLQNSFW